MTILVVEDEKSIGQLLKMTLSDAGYQVHLVQNGDQALEWLQKNDVALILLDWMLPKTNGLTVLKSLRSDPTKQHIPVIMLTARGAEVDRITGLDHGADDYITKPFSTKELLARVRALLRRIQGAGISQESTGDETLTVGDIQLNFSQRRIWRNGNEVNLGPTEFRLLEYFMRHPGQVFSRDQLLDQVWGHGADVEDRTVDVHIRRLRKALNLWGRDVIRTVRSMGYALERL